MITKTSLLPHQEEAVKKLHRIRIGALYMEMGTGKTRTALEFVKLRLESGKITHIIWLCPCSVKQNLLNDIKKHSDLADIDGLLTVCGIETLSSSVAMCSKLLSISETHDTFLIVDESSLVKNHSAIRSVHITQIAQHCKYRMILNGTPITKCVADLFSQWYILDKRVLGYNSFYSFAANHLEYDPDRPGRIVAAHNEEYLTRKIMPYTFQCKKSDVMQLPPKITTCSGFHLTGEQYAMYDECIDRLLTNLDTMSSESIYKLFGALQSIASGFKINYCKNGKVTRHRYFEYPVDNPRIKELIYQIEKIGNEKSIIFCQYTSEIEDVCSVLNKRQSGSAVAFYGEIQQKKRQEQIEKFRCDAQFLVANKNCGAFGLNLQFCHNIIFYSNDWNWGTRAQAEDRVHRFGQTETVKIVDIFALWTIEAKILRCLENKENLADKFKNEISKQAVLDFIGGERDAEDLPTAKCVRGNKRTS